jgi:hypothetical protein
MRRLIPPLLGALGVTLYLLNLRRAGARTERVRLQRLELEHRNATTQAMLDAAIRRPADRSAVMQRLRNGGF